MCLISLDFKLSLQITKQLYYKAHFITTEAILQQQQPQKLQTRLKDYKIQNIIQQQITNNKQQITNNKQQITNNKQQQQIIKSIKQYTNTGTSMKSQLAKKLRSLKILAYAYRFQICRVSAILSLTYILLSLFSIGVLLCFGIFFASLAGIAYFKYRALRETGVINMCSNKTKDILLRRSIMDVFRDLVYYPYVTKIIGVFVKAAISKPHPEQFDKLFDQLPENIKNAVFTKGILKLTPEKLQSLVIEKKVSILDELESQLDNQVAKKQVKQAKQVKKQPKNNQIIPINFGKVQKKWDKLQQYQAEQIKTHEHTFSKQMLIKLNDKVHWKHIIPLAGLVAIAAMQTKKKKLGKILLYNGSVAGIFILLALIVIKYKKPYQIYGKRLAIIPPPQLKVQ